MLKVRPGLEWVQQAGLHDTVSGTGVGILPSCHSDHKVPQRRLCILGMLDSHCPGSSKTLEIHLRQGSHIAALIQVSRTAAPAGHHSGYDRLTTQHWHLIVSDEVCQVILPLAWISVGHKALRRQRSYSAIHPFYASKPGEGFPKDSRCIHMVHYQSGIGYMSDVSHHTAR